MVPKHVVHEKDEYPPPDPSDSEDEEEMEGYYNLFKQLQDTSVVRPASSKVTTEILSLSAS